MRKEIAKALNVASVVALMKSIRASCSNGVFDKMRKKKRRQGDVKNKEIHPGQPLVGELLKLPAGKADENQAEEREGEVEHIDHRPSL